MKKISLLLVVLLAAGSASLYGQMEISTAFEVKGNATATVGYNIDNEQFGFKNESSSSIKLELVPKQTINNSDMVEMGGWYGYIELKEFKIVIDSEEDDSTEFLTSEAMMDDPMTMDEDESADAGKDRTRLVVTKPGIVAMLKNGPLFLKIFDAPEQKADLIAAIEDDEDDDYKAEGNDKDNHVKTDLSGAGVTLGYDSDDLDVSLGITSDEDWDGKYPDQPDDHVEGTPDDSSFSISADLAVNVGAADLQLQVVQGLKAAQDMDEIADDTGVAGKLTTTFGDIALNAGADLVMTGKTNEPDTAEDESLEFEVGMGADVELTTNTMFGAKYLYSSKQLVASDVEVVLKDTGGLVDRLSLGLTWGLFDINNGKADADKKTENDLMDMQVKGNLGYDLDAMGGTLTPSAELSLSQIDDESANVELAVKAVLKDAVPATEFGLQWKTAELFDGPDADDDRQQGSVTAWAKITYG